MSNDKNKNVNNAKKQAFKTRETEERAREPRKSRPRAEERTERASKTHKTRKTQKNDEPKKSMPARVRSDVFFTPSKPLKNLIP